MCAYVITCDCGMCMRSFEGAFVPGICCGEDGDGSYQALLDGVVVASGGQYGSSESTQFALSPICRTFDLDIVTDYLRFPEAISWQVPT